MGGRHAVTALSRYLSHDVATALRFGRLNVRNIERDLASGSPEALHRHIQSLRNRLDCAELILKRVRDFGEVVDLDVEPERLALGGLAQEFGRIVEQRGFAWECASPPLQVVTGTDPLWLALAGLVRNAIDHHDRPTGTVRLDWSRAAGRIEFRISDDGPGIPDDRRAALFRFGGTIGPRDMLRHAGLGLVMVAHLIELLEQELEIVSNPRGSRGTTVRMTWPTDWPVGGLKTEL